MPSTLINLRKQVTMNEQLAIYLWSISTNISCGLVGIGIAIIIFGCKERRK